jgi:hypothetical protein
VPRSKPSALLSIVSHRQAVFAVWWSLGVERVLRRKKGFKALLAATIEESAVYTH